MQISFGKAVIRSRATLVVVPGILLAVIVLASCSSGPEQAAVTKVDRPFPAAGKIEMQLGSGAFRPDKPL